MIRLNWYIGGHYVFPESFDLNNCCTCVIKLITYRSKNKVQWSVHLLLWFIIIMDNYGCLLFCLQMAQAHKNDENGLDKQCWSIHQKVCQAKRFKQFVEKVWHFNLSLYKVQSNVCVTDISYDSFQLYANEIFFLVLSIV